jgi:hypothetical protein
VPRQRIEQTHHALDHLDRRFVFLVGHFGILEKSSIGFYSMK